ncbi:MAG: hypothetical protein LBK82_16130 [Planctomycetaceae bacterium]|nr:hypothetical protein [Planctomycetaceae bacterium]
MPLISSGNWIPKPLATPFAVVNLIHSRLSPTRPFSERSPTSFHLFSCVSCLKRTFQGLDT